MSRREPRHSSSHAVLTPAATLHHLSRKQRPPTPNLPSMCQQRPEGGVTQAEFWKEHVGNDTRSQDNLACSSQPHVLSISDQTNEGRGRGQKGVCPISPAPLLGAPFLPAQASYLSLLALQHCPHRGQRWALQAGAADCSLSAGSGQATVPQWDRYQGWAQPAQGPALPGQAKDVQGCVSTAPRGRGGGAPTPVGRGGWGEVFPPGGAPKPGLL